MEVREVKRHIQQRSFNAFYIFTGEEIEAQRIYINKIAEVTGRAVVRLETVADVIRQRSGFISQPTLYIVRDDTAFMQAEKVWADIDALLKDKMLIMQLSDVDKRKKFYKYFEDRIVTFHYMTADVLYKYVQRQAELSEKNTEALIDTCGCDYSRVLLETDKIKQYADATGETQDGACSSLLADGTIYRQPEDAIFDFVDAVLKAQPDRAYRLLADCKAIDDSALAILSVLYTNFKRVLQVQTCNSSDICNTTGLSARDVAIGKKAAGYWQSEDIVQFLKILQRTEKGIKTGQIEADIAVDYALSHIF